MGYSLAFLTEFFYKCLGRCLFPYLYCSYFSLGIRLVKVQRLLQILLLLGITLSATPSFIRHALAEKPPPSFSDKFFSHKIALGSAPGENGAFALVIDDQFKARKTRLLIDIDNRFYALPLLPSKSVGAFLGKFPTPESSLKYKIQIVLRSGEAFTSATYQVDQDCNEKLLLELDKKGGERVQNERVIRDIAALDSQIKLLKKFESELSPVPTISERKLR